MARFIHLAVLLLMLGCGSITIDVETRVEDENDITHTLKLEMTGQIAELADEGGEEFSTIDDPYMREHCEIERGPQRLAMSCSELKHDELLSGSEEPFLVYVTKIDKGDSWEYRATMANVFHDTEDEFANDPLTADMDMDLILRARQYWTVTMPGEIVESNSENSPYAKSGSGEADSVDFTGTIGDSRPQFEVISRQDKPSGLFGFCS